MALGILEQLETQGLVRPIDEVAHNSAEYLHVLIEVLRFVRAFFQVLSMFLFNCLSPQHRFYRYGTSFCAFTTFNPEKIPCGTFRTKIKERYPHKNSSRRWELIHGTPSQCF